MKISTTTLDYLESQSQGRPFIELSAETLEGLIHYTRMYFKAVVAHDRLVDTLMKAVNRQGFTNDELITANALITKAKEGGFPQ